ncbi:MAG: glycosyltransferase, partial [Alphaproteobacteria bacterium]|nr:glycosyltransferase [Alphaproteobacteria bacterium]
MNILYVSPAPVTRSETGQLTSFLASVRYRVILPARQLVRRGHAVDIRVTPPDGWDAETARAMTADVAVFAKSFQRSDIALARSLRERGTKVVFDASDDYFDHPESGAAFARIIDLADEIVASTDEMARTILRRSGRRATVIGDPVEGRRREPVLEPRFPRVKLLWFGHPLSLDTLWPLVPRLAALPAAFPWELHVVTTPLPEVTAKVEALRAAAPATCALRFTPWSIDATWKALADADIVVIPSADDMKKQVKSQNRLLESIQAGRFVVADPIPSYQPFADFAWIGRDLVEGIVWACENPAEAVRRVGEGQRAIALDWSAYAIADQWETVLTGTAAQRPLR